MDDPVVVTRGHGGQELHDERLDFGSEKGCRHVGEERLEVVLDEVHHDEDSIKRVSLSVQPVAMEGQLHSLGERVSYDHLAHPHNVLVRYGHERLDLPQTGDGEAVLLLVHLELLEGDDVPGRLAAGAKNDAVAPFLNLVQALRFDRSTGSRQKVYHESMYMDGRTS